MGGEWLYSSNSQPCCCLYRLVSGLAGDFVAQLPSALCKNTTGQQLLCNFATPQPPPTPAGLSSFCSLSIVVFAKRKESSWK